MNFSLLTCTYSPNKQVFRRLLNAVEYLQIPDNTKLEWIIVDNNSPQPLEQQVYIQDAIKRIGFARVIAEKRQGLTYARNTGTKVAKFDWIIFFDDDNEPHTQYLMSLRKLIHNNPKVFCWGTGSIFVRFLETKNQGNLNQYKSIFQERHLDNDKIFEGQHWGKNYPIGTGMCARRETLNSYVQFVEKGIYTATDRTGRSLVSGGDIQIVMHFLRQGLQVGTSPTLVLNHLIEKRKTELNYIIKQQYWTASSNIFVWNQVYEEKVSLKFLSSSQILLKIVKQFYYFLRVKELSIAGACVALGSVLGEINSRYVAAEKNAPWPLKLFEKIIQ